MPGQLYAVSWVSRLRPASTQPEIEPRSVVMPLALRCNALDRCVFEFWSWEMERATDKIAKSYAEELARRGFAMMVITRSQDKLDDVPYSKMD
uniref:Uncharacterized protein n=1 Tax=Hucho hucho TaxID=62062 RepID=A0A4W5MQM7_9TELE